MSFTAIAEVSAAMMRLLGLDHADIRVSSLADVEAFYDALLPALGLLRKVRSHVAADGEWYPADERRPPNAIEYMTPVEAGAPGWFIGFIEARSMPSLSRIALRLDEESALPAVHALLTQCGARNIEWSTSSDYPAVFFEDPAGTRLEICARRPSGLHS